MAKGYTATNTDTGLTAIQREDGLYYIRDIRTGREVRLEGGEPDYWGNRSRVQVGDFTWEYDSAKLKARLRKFIADPYCRFYYFGEK